MSDSEFGVGLQLNRSFDVRSDVGQLGTVFGQPTIQRDIAFTLAREANRLRGTIPDADFANELELLTRRVLSRDPRISTVQSVVVDLDPPTSSDRTASVEISLTTASGQTDALLIDF